VLLRIKIGLALTSLLAAYGLWLGVLRDLPLFQVQSVTITGLSGTPAPQVSATLELTAREMTTTDFSLSRLRQALAGYQSVASITARTEFPHGVRITVVERRPLARLDYKGTIVAVAGNDQVLSGVAAPHALPLIRSAAAPVAGRVLDPLGREEVALLAAAPVGLLSDVYQVRLGSQGLTVRLRHGPLIYFGGAELPHAKWDSAAAVLSSPSSRGARYIDVSLPARPAAAVGDSATAAGTGGAPGSASVATIVGGRGSATSSSTSG